MKYILLILVFNLNISCTSTKKVKDTVTDTDRPILVYKTNNDYFDKVPIILSADKKKIISYPHPTDLIKDGNFVTPTKLLNGYLLDNRGLSVNSAFLKLTYKEYSKLETTLSLSELKELIIDDNPFSELYNCGLKSDFEDLEKQINMAIKKKQLDRFKRLI